MASLDRMTGARHVFMPNVPSVGKARVILPAISWAACDGLFCAAAIQSGACLLRVKTRMASDPPYVSFHRQRT
jgi:hypothetical protein